MQSVSTQQSTRQSLPISDSEVLRRISSVSWEELVTKPTPDEWLIDCMEVVGQYELPYAGLPELQPFQVRSIQKDVTNSLAQFSTVLDYREFKTKSTARKKEDISAIITSCIPDNRRSLFIVFFKISISPIVFLRRKYFPGEEDVDRREAINFLPNPLNNHSLRQSEQIKFACDCISTFSRNLISSLPTARCKSRKVCHLEIIWDFYSLSGEYYIDELKQMIDENCIDIQSKVASEDNFYRGVYKSDSYLGTYQKTDLIARLQLALDEKIRISKNGDSTTRCSKPFKIKSKYQTHSGLNLAALIKDGLDIYLDEAIRANWLDQKVSKISHDQLWNYFTQAGIPAGPAKTILDQINRTGQIISDPKIRPYVSNLKNLGAVKCLAKGIYKLVSPLPAIVQEARNRPSTNKLSWVAIDEKLDKMDWDERLDAFAWMLTQGLIQSRAAEAN